MAGFNNTKVHAETYIAGADLSAKQYTFVTSDGDEVTTTGAGEAATGVLFNAPVAADAATVVRGGEVIVTVGTGGLAIGGEVASDAAGLAVAATSTDVVVGIARTAAAAGGLATVTFLPQAQYTKA